jgi:preprotein translocase subunit SecY
MNLKTLLIIKATVCIVLGCIILFVPNFLYTFFGAHLNDGGFFAAREYGSSLIGGFLLTWYARNAVESQARRAIILDLFVYDAIGAVITVIAVLTGVLNPLGWAVFALYLLLAIGFGYFWFANPTTVPQPKPV